MKKRLLKLVLLSSMLFSVGGQIPVIAEETADTSVQTAAETEAQEITTQISALENIEKYGNVNLDMTCEDFLAAGYEPGDLADVTFMGQTLTLPVCDNYANIDSGTPGLFARSGDTYIKLAINMGSFADVYGIAYKTVNEDKSYYWTAQDGVELPITVTISMKEKRGYYDEYVMHSISYTDERENYPDLTDEEFANFRNVATTGIAADTLYRSASPVNPEHNRNTYADAAIKAAGVTVVMNLADSRDDVVAYEGYEDSYYSTTSYIALNLGVDTTSEEFRSGLGEGLKFFAENPGIYEIHCTEGKDRAGFVCAVIECFMGASAEEVVKDYMITFYNYYGITEEDARYSVIASSNIVKSLQNAFGVEDLYSADLQACAEQYIRDAGLNEEEIEQLRKNLGGAEELTVPSAEDFTFRAPEDLTCTGKEKTAAVVPADGVEGMGEITVYYCSIAADGTEGDPTAEAPVRAGTYRVKILTSEGTAYAAAEDYITADSWTFTIPEADTPAENKESGNRTAAPDTGDSSALLWMLLMMTAVTGAAGCSFVLRRTH